mmetsp:Transcript_33431/g.70080  ORF Transcript_33431/g.70080 Transcript_33431/m.70080 type:complete len:227 (+) Transcript_33431:14-694(+)
MHHARVSGTGARQGCTTMTTSPMLSTALRNVLFHHAKSRTSDLCCDTEKTSNQITWSWPELPGKRRWTASTKSRKRYFQAWLRKTLAVATKAPCPSEMSCSHSDCCFCSVQGFTNISMTSYVVNFPRTDSELPPHTHLLASHFLINSVKYDSRTPRRERSENTATLTARCRRDAIRAATKHAKLLNQASGLDTPWAAEADCVSSSGAQSPKRDQSSASCRLSQLSL